MRTPFQYSVLYYQHSAFTQERLTVGLLFYFPEEKEIRFVRPQSLQRISSFQYGFEPAFIKKILSRFTSKSNLLTKKWSEVSLPYLNDFSDIIHSDFLVQDSSSLQFSAPKSGIVPETKEKLISYYTGEFFRNYQLHDVHDKTDDARIIHTFSKALLNKKADYKKIVKPDVKIKGDFFEEKFEFGWQNGKFNYVRPLGFDLEKAESIKRKSQQQIGVINNLEKAITSNNANIHFLVSKPSNKSLFTAYENALAILDSYHKAEIGRVVDFEKLEDYVDEVIETGKFLE